MGPALNPCWSRAAMRSWSVRTHGSGTSASPGSSPSLLSQTEYSLHFDKERNSNGSSLRVWDIPRSSWRLHFAKCSIFIWFGCRAWMLFTFCRSWKTLQGQSSQQSQTTGPSHLIGFFFSLIYFKNSTFLSSEGETTNSDFFFSCPFLSNVSVLSLNVKLAVGCHEGFPPSPTYSLYIPWQHRNTCMSKEQRSKWAWQVLSACAHDCKWQQRLQKGLV